MVQNHIQNASQYHFSLLFKFWNPATDGEVPPARSVLGLRWLDKQAVGKGVLTLSAATTALLSFYYCHKWLHHRQSKLPFLLCYQWKMTLYLCFLRQVLFLSGIDRTVSFCCYDVIHCGPAERPAGQQLLNGPYQTPCNPVSLNTVTDTNWGMIAQPCVPQHCHWHKKDSRSTLCSQHCDWHKLRDSRSTLCP